MNLTVDPKAVKTNKPEMEEVERNKQEYYLLGSFIRTKGLKVFGYNHLKDELFEVHIQKGNSIHVMPVNGKLLSFDPESEKVMVDSRFSYFEALRIESAVKRLIKYKKGEIRDLCNLKRYDPESIVLF